MLTKQSVLDIFESFTQRFEGSVSFMYLDVKGLVTTGYGNLIDPPGLAFPIPWVHKSDEKPASQGEIFSEWNRVKARQDMKLEGGGFFSQMTTLKLMPDAMKNLLLQKMQSNEEVLLKRFPKFTAMPADAQLGIHSMAWAAGPMFGFPKCVAALNAFDFHTAQLESHMDDTHNPGLVPRNRANVVLFSNAATVWEACQGDRPYDFDPDKVYWPEAL